MKMTVASFVSNSISPIFIAGGMALLPILIMQHAALNRVSDRLSRPGKQETYDFIIGMYARIKKAMNIMQILDFRGQHYRFGKKMGFFGGD